jgi:hypothetical protein
MAPRNQPRSINKIYPYLLIIDGRDSTELFKEPTCCAKQTQRINIFQPSNSCRFSQKRNFPYYLLINNYQQVWKILILEKTLYIQ